MGSELTVTPQEQDLRVLTDPSKRKLMSLVEKQIKW